MVVPNRPAPGSPIESTWGDAVHDASVMARGVIVEGNVATEGGSAPGTVMDLVTVIGGDASMVDLAANRFIAPVDGVYRLDASLIAENYTGGAYRGFIGVNAGASSGWEWSTVGAGGNQQGFFVGAVLELNAGDHVTINHGSPTAGSGNALAAVRRAAFWLQAAAIGAS